VQDGVVKGKSLTIELAGDGSDVALATEAREEGQGDTLSADLVDEGAYEGGSMLILIGDGGALELPLPQELDAEDAISRDGASGMRFEVYAPGKEGDLSPDIGRYGSQEDGLDGGLGQRGSDVDDAGVVAEGARYRNCIARTADL
jgi:hypothetical protein